MSESHGSDPLIVQPDESASGGSEPALTGRVPVRDTLAGLGWSAADLEPLVLPSMSADEWWGDCKRGDLMIRCVRPARRGSPRHRRQISCIINCVWDIVGIMEAEPEAAVNFKTACDRCGALENFGVLMEVEAWAAGSSSGVPRFGYLAKVHINFGGATKPPWYELHILLRESLKSVIAATESAESSGHSGSAVIQYAGAAIEMARGAPWLPPPCSVALARAADIVRTSFPTFASAATLEE